MNRIWSMMSRRVLVPAGLGGILILAGLAGVLWQYLDVTAPPIQALAGEIVYAAKAGPRIQIEPTAPPIATSVPTPTPEQPISHASFTRGIATPAVSDGQALAPTDTARRPPPTAVPPVATRHSTLAPTPRPSAHPSPQPTAPAAAIPEPATEPPTRIVAPAIHLDVTVVNMGWKTVRRDGDAVTEWVVPKNTAGWHINSALPGRSGNTVISGHNNVEGEVFRYVPDLEIGDRITLYAGAKTYTYTVREKHLVQEAGVPHSERQKNAQWIAPTDDVRLTLITCWPYRWPGNTHRMIVVARP